MTINLGDFAAGAVIDFKWASAGLSGQAITRATDGQVRVYKGNGAAESTTGVTDTEDFDSLTGIHHCRIDTSADGTFYAEANEFMVVLAGAVIDGQTVNTVLAHFSLKNRIAKAPADTVSALLASEADGIDLIELFRALGAVLLGDAAGLDGGTPSFDAADGSKTRLDYTIAAGARSLVKDLT